jgi:hypothetical protein
MEDRVSAVPVVEVRGRRAAGAADLLTITGRMVGRAVPAAAVARPEQAARPEGVHLDFSSSTLRFRRQNRYFEEEEEGVEVPEAREEPEDQALQEARAQMLRALSRRVQRVKILTL